MLFEDTYKTIESESSGLYKEKGSKFIALAYPVKSESEVKEIIDQIKKKYYDARHHCYAYVLGFDKSAWRVNDDGEPSGTAGKPIHGQLLSYDLTNTLLVVIRYFGGTKLGVSGLINAYKQAARDALQNATIIEKTINEVYKLSFPFESMNDAMKIVKDFGLQIVDSNYDSNAYIIYKIRLNDAQKVIAKIKTSYRFDLIYIKSE